MSLECRSLWQSHLTLAVCQQPLSQKKLCVTGCCLPHVSYFSMVAGQILHVRSFILDPKPASINLIHLVKLRYFCPASADSIFVLIGRGFSGQAYKIKVWSRKTTDSLWMCWDLQNSTSMTWCDNRTTVFVGQIHWEACAKESHQVHQLQLGLGVLSWCRFFFLVLRTPFDEFSIWRWFQTFQTNLSRYVEKIVEVPQAGIHSVALGSGSNMKQCFEAHGGLWRCFKYLLFVGDIWRTTHWSARSDPCGSCHAGGEIVVNVWNANIISPKLVCCTPESCWIDAVSVDFVRYHDLMCNLSRRKYPRRPRWPCWQRRPTNDTLFLCWALLCLFIQILETSGCSSTAGEDCRGLGVESIAAHFEEAQMMTPSIESCG